jgi:molybdenum cofactor biosynthesis enzyme MoaA
MVDINTGTMCNNSCIMCTTMRTLDFKSSKQRLLDKEEVIAQIVKIKPDDDMITFTGGEPTLQEDLFEFIHIVHQNVPSSDIQLLTNGRRLYYEDYVKDLLRTEISKIVIPVHGHTKELHDFITRSKNSFIQTITGLKNISKYAHKRLHIEIRIVIHGANYPFICDIFSLIHSIIPQAWINLLYHDSIGSGFLNRDRLLVPLSKTIPYIIDAFSVHHERKYLYHYPLCLFPEKYHRFLYGVTTNTNRIGFSPKCNSCAKKECCAGLWKTYLNVHGDKELVPYSK